MNKQHFSGAIGLLGLLAISSSAFAQTVDVQQYWTSASESKAMNVIADAFKAHGGKWIDSPSADFDSTIAAATSRIAGGEPPSAVLMTPSAAMRDLASSGQLRTLDDLASANGWQKAMVPIVWDKLTVDGHLVGLPVGIHADNWVWYSKSAFVKAGIEEPKTLDEMFAAADKLKATGSIPFAVGGEPWQEVYVLTSMIISLGGPEYWNDLFVKRDPEALKSPILPKAFELFRKVETYTDPASPGRSWNATTSLVATGKAGMQFMGDWARGEFLAAGQTAGKEFGCFLVPTEKPAYAVVVDIFTFPVNKDEDRIKGQTLLAETVMDPVVEAKIAAVKGSVPSRLDVDTSSLDLCAVKGVKALATPGVAVSSTYDALPGDLNGQMTDLATQFWTDPSMSVETAVKGLADILQSK